ncbi:hypothetical protein [Mollivirus kamchatka]|nr:hypothetical protein [Mollivirus kamchatka]
MQGWLPTASESKLAKAKACVSELLEAVDGYNNLLRLSLSAMSPLAMSVGYNVGTQRIGQPASPKWNLWISPTTAPADLFVFQGYADLASPRDYGSRVTQWVTKLQEARSQLDAAAAIIGAPHRYPRVPRPNAESLPLVKVGDLLATLLDVGDGHGVSTLLDAISHESIQYAKMDFELPSYTRSRPHVALPLLLSSAMSRRCNPYPPSQFCSTVNRLYHITDILKSISVDLSHALEGWVGSSSAVAEHFDNLAHLIDLWTDDEACLARLECFAQASAGSNKATTITVAGNEVNRVTLTAKVIAEFANEVCDVSLHACHGRFGLTISPDSLITLTYAIGRLVRLGVYDVSSIPVPKNTASDYLNDVECPITTLRDMVKVWIAGHATRVDDAGLIAQEADKFANAGFEHWAIAHISDIIRKGHDTEVLAMISEVTTFCVPDEVASARAKRLLSDLADVAEHHGLDPALAQEYRQLMAKTAEIRGYDIVEVEDNDQEEEEEDAKEEKNGETDCGVVAESKPELPNVVDDVEPNHD